MHLSVDHTITPTGMNALNRTPRRSTARLTFTSSRLHSSVEGQVELIHGIPYYY